MAELRHATVAAAATRASSSPAKRDAEAATSASSPFLPSLRGGDGGKDGAPRSSPPLHQRCPLPAPVRALLALEDPRSPSASTSYRILLAVLACLALAALVSAPSLWLHLVNGRGSLWENPHTDLVSENETSGYIFIHAEGGLNQQRIAICNAIAIAKIMNATLILPVLKQDQIWKDQTKFEDIFDVDHFINYLKYDVRIVRDIPDWFTEKDELFTSIKRTVKNIPNYASAQFYVDNVLPRIKEKKIMSIKPFVDRLGYDNVPMKINRLRCRVNYHALKFLPGIEEMADKLATRMRNRTGNVNPYM
ncbi:hypothetical protein ACQ4PT_071272 [Festuca glaucescens]